MLKNCLNTCLLAFVLLSTVSFTKAQNLLIRSFDVPVSIEDIQINNAWVGGLNSPQFSTFNANDDGWEDLFVFDRDGNNLMVFLNTASSKERSDPVEVLV